MNTLIDIVILTFIGLFLLVYPIYKIYNFQRKRKNFSMNMKVGDDASIISASSDFTGKITEINDDSVVISVTVDKNRVYPNS